MKRIAAMVLSDLGELIPHTCQSTMSLCEEEAPNVLAAWPKMKELGARVVQVEISIISIMDEVKALSNERL